MVVKSLKCLTVLFSCIMLHDWMIAWHMMFWLCIQLTWHWYVNYLTLGIWHWCLICHHLTPDFWHLISDTWQSTCYHLILDISYHLVLIHLTWCCDTWLDTITPDTCIIFTGTWHSYYTTTRHLVLLNSCAPKLMYSWTLETGRLLILYSCWSP